VRKGLEQREPAAGQRGEVLGVGHELRVPAGVLGVLGQRRHQAAHDEPLEAGPLPRIEHVQHEPLVQGELVDRGRLPGQDPLPERLHEQRGHPVELPDVGGAALLEDPGDVGDLLLIVEVRAQGAPQGLAPLRQERVGEGQGGDQLRQGAESGIEERHVRAGGALTPRGAARAPRRRTA
jgi:hypothetical protein